MPETMAKWTIQKLDLFGIRIPTVLHFISKSNENLIVKQFWQPNEQTYF
jgi:hypothetical protein